MRKYLFTDFQNSLLYLPHILLGLHSTHNDGTFTTKLACFKILVVGYQQSNSFGWYSIINL